MYSNVDKLSYLFNRPFWAMIPAEIQAVVAELIKAEGVESAEFVAKWALKKGIASAVAEEFQNATPLGTKIAVVPIIGPLSGDPDVLFYGGTSYGSIQNAIARAAEDPGVREILLLVDSPGGEVMGCPETADAIFAARQQKAVTALVTGWAASAAYYLTSQASHITLTPSGEVGSVGVLLIHADVSEMLAKAGINITTISAGKYKTEFYPYAPLSEDAKTSAQAQIDTMYQNFLTAVKRGRGASMTADGLDSNFGDGRMLDAGQAVAAGMVDSIVTVAAALKDRKMKMRAALEGRNRALALEGDESL